MTLFCNIFMKYKTSVHPLSSVFMLTDGHKGRYNGRFAGMLMHKTGVCGCVIVIVVVRGGGGGVFPTHHVM